MLTSWKIRPAGSTIRLTLTFLLLRLTSRWYRLPAVLMLSSKTASLLFIKDVTCSTGITHPWRGLLFLLKRSRESSKLSFLWASGPKTTFRRFQWNLWDFIFWPVKIFSLVSKTEKIRPEGSRVLGWILVIAGKFLCDWRTVDKAFKNYPPDATSRSRRSIQKETQLPDRPHSF